jgi:hypothetical protein
MKKYFLFFLVLHITLIANSQQIRQFTADSTIYIDEIKKFTSNYISSAESEILNEFIVLWNTGGLSWDEMKAIAENSTLLVKKNGRPSPQFINYFESLNILYASDAPKVGREEWQKALAFFLSDKNSGIKTLNEFFKSTLILLKNNQLFNLTGNVWQGLNSSFTFGFKNDIFRVVFDNMDLVCYSKRDSIKIFNTSGSLDPINNTWFGEKGLVTWERAALSRNDVYVNLQNFQIDLRKSEYTADSVWFSYQKYLDAPLLGRFEDKVMLITEPQRASYPKFFSYQNKYILPDLFKDMEYMGGLSMHGPNLNGTGTKFEPALLNIFDNGILRMRVESELLFFLAASASSPSSKVFLFIENDSVFHPDVQFSFNEANNEIKLTKSKTFTSASPYTNSYHQMDMNFEEFSWRRNERFIRFRPLTGTAMGIATFESHSFFNSTFFEELQGMDAINPLVALWQFGRMNNQESFTLPSYARYLAKDPSQVRQQLMRLSRTGFVYYDDIADVITPRPKLFYFLDSSVGKVDYDVILFSSRTQAPLENAILDLENYDLTINGVTHISISDSQNVVLLPENNKIVMKRNKSFQFDGVVHAGLFSFYGKNYFFEYDSFKINMQDIDSISFAVNSDKEDNTGRLIAENINNLVEDATGELLIDEPFNKSGLQDFPQYPTFISRESSYVYFDERSIQNGVYDRNSMYFQVDPFAMDSLDNFTRDGFQLTGKFVSGGILPPLNQTLGLMSDNSLGFTHKIPDNGIPLYDGKATFYQQVELSNKGLRGSGKLEYLTSTTWSDDFLFHPDSLLTTSRDFTIGKQYTAVEYPEVKSKNNSITWLTKQDQFKASQKDIPFTMFEDTIQMHGKLLLEPKGLSGNGKVEMITASLTSDLIEYKADQIFSDSADFQLRSPSHNKLAFSTDNVNAHIDFKNLEGEFVPNIGYVTVEFPENRYISQLDYFLWIMDEQQLHMGLDKPVTTSPGEDGLLGPRYFSVHPDQDSLNFVSPMALYDYNNFIIMATEVQYVQVADARIYPPDGLIVIEPNAKIKQITEAEIIADYRTENFRLYDAAVSIYGKKDYSASAKYDYVDFTGKEQIIAFSSIRVDSMLQTIGSTDLTTLDNFKLSPYFEYQGKVHLAAQNPLLSFDGAARIVHDCIMPKSWLKFKAELDPLNILIPVSSAPMDINLNRIYAGIMLTRDSAHVYSTFTSGKKDYFDNYISSAEGYLMYDLPNNRYEIAHLDKLSDSLSNGNYMHLDPNSCVVYSEGKIDLLTNFGQLKLDAFGKIWNDMENDSFKAEVMLALDFFFSQDALNIFSSNIDSLADLKAFDPTNPLYKLALQEMVGSKSALRMSNDLGLYGAYRDVPDEFKKSIIISNANLTWNMNTRSYRYNGKIGIVRVGDKQVNKEAEVYIELSKRASGDLLDLYFKLNDNNWYYFGYNPGSFQVTSSNRQFNSIVYELKDNQRKMNVKPGEQSFIYALAPERRAELFLRRFMDEELVQK